MNSIKFLSNVSNRKRNRLLSNQVSIYMKECHGISGICSPPFKNKRTLWWRKERNLHTYFQKFNSYIHTIHTLVFQSCYLEVWWKDRLVKMFTIAWRGGATKLREEFGHMTPPPAMAGGKVKELRPSPAKPLAIPPTILQPFLGPIFCQSKKNKYK